MIKKSLILFDYDGVLVDSLHHNLAIVRKACESLGFSDYPDIDYCRTAPCISFEAWAKQIGMGDELLPEFLNQILLSLRESASSLVIFPGISEVIKALSKDNTLGIITSNTALAAREFVAHHELNTCFQEYVGADQVGTKSEKILSIATKLGFPTEATYYIGDAGTDVQQGKSAGVKTIAVTWGFQSRARLEEEGPDFIVDEPMELLLFVPTG